MVPILAKQAVVIKCQAQSGILVSNYECAYAMGLLAKIAGVEPPTDDIPVAQGLEQMLSKTAEYQAVDERESHLLEMLQAYKPDATMDEQVVQLLHMGYKEERLWER